MRKDCRRRRIKSAPIQRYSNRCRDHFGFIEKFFRQAL
jgi:hypothetical protein